MKRKIMKWLIEAIRKLSLQSYSVTITSWDVDEQNVLMKVSCNPEYLFANIEVNLKFCKTLSDEEVRLACFHEMLHVLLWRFSTFAKERYVSAKQLRQEEESVCQILSRALSA